MVAYTRQSTITDGDTITAALFNNEYNQLLSAFSYASSGTTGHKHDGTAGEGGHVPQIGDQDFLNKIVTDSTNNRFGIFVQVSSSAVEQIRIQDGAIVPVTDNDIDLGTSSVEFKDAYFDGTVTTDALVADTADINGGTVDGATIGASSATTGVFTTIQGSTITATTAFVPDASDGAALGTSSLEFSDLFLADAAVINFGDDQDVTLTHVADTGLLLNSTMQLQFNDSSQFINAPSATVLDINATDEIELNATLVDVNANLDISGTYTGAGLMTTGGNIVIPNDGNIGSVGDTDAIAISSGGVVTFSQNPVFPDGGVPLDDLDIDGATDIGAALVDADLFIVDDGAGGTNRKTAASRIKTYVGASTGGFAVANLDIDGATDIGANIADADLFVIDDGAGGTNRKTEASRIKTYIADVTLTTAAQTNITSLGTLTALTVDDIGVDGKVITMTGSTNDTATLTVGTNGTLTIETVDTAAAAANIQVTADGTFEVDGTTITLDSSGDIVLDADGGDVFFKDAGTTFGSATNTSGNLIIKSGTTTALTFSGANVTGAGTYTGGGTMTTGGNIIIPDDGNIGSASDTDAIAISSAGLVTISQDLSVTDDVTIGDDLLLDSDAAVLKFGDDQDVTLTHVADTGLLLNSTMQLQFNDASQNINAPSATVLDINATDEVEINATLADVNANLDVSGTYTGGGLMTTGGNIVIPDAGNIGSASDTDAIAISSAGLVTVSQDLTVGDDLKLASDAAVLGFGADNDVTLTHVADTGLLLNSTMQLQFNDASQNINAPSATVLDINATDEIELNATLADVNANLDVSGTYTGGGTMTTGGNIVIPDDGNIGSASDTDAMAIASTGQVTFSQNINPPHPARNYLVNGDFAVSQRLNGAVATSATTPANSDDTVLIDRWILLSDGNDIVDVGRSVANRTDMQYVGYNVVETADKKFGFAQIIENRDAAQLVGGSAVVTLSFIAAVNNTSRLDDIRAGIVSWSSTADSVTSDLVNSWGSADANPTLASNWTFENTPANLSVGTSFARYSVTATIDTSSTTNVAAFIWSNSVDNDVDDIFYLGGCQLELGSYPTPFITESYQENLARCQRYYEIIQIQGYARVGNSINTNDTRGHAFDFKTEKRTNSITMGHSTIGRSNGQFSFTSDSGNYVSTDPDDIGAYLTTTNASIYATSSTNIAGLTNDSISSIYVNGVAELNFDAEL